MSIFLGLGVLEVDLIFSKVLEYLPRAGNAIVVDLIFSKVVATREPCTTAWPCNRGRKGGSCEEQDLLGDGVHGEGQPARVLEVEGQAVCHQEGPDWFCL